MCEDESEIKARSHRLVETVGIDGEKPVCLQGKPEGLADCVFHTDIWVQNEERLFVEYGLAFRLPVMLVSVKHIECRLHTTADSGSDIRNKLAAYPEEIRQGSCPEQLFRKQEWSKPQLV